MAVALSWPVTGRGSLPALEGGSLLVLSFYSWGYGPRVSQSVRGVVICSQARSKLVAQSQFSGSRILRRRAVRAIRSGMLIRVRRMVAVSALISLPPASVPKVLGTPGG